MKTIEFCCNSSGQECDRYGFYKAGDDMDEDVLTARAQQLQKESTEITNKLKAIILYQHLQMSRKLLFTIWSGINNKCRVMFLEHLI